MKIFEVDGNGIDALYSKGNEFLLLWLLIVDFDNWREHEISQRVCSLDIADLPACVIVADARRNAWVHDEIGDYLGGVMLIPYCGGFGVNASTRADEFNDKAEMAIDLARQAKEGWLKSLRDEG